MASAAQAGHRSRNDVDLGSGIASAGSGARVRSPRPPAHGSARECSSSASSAPRPARTHGMSLHTPGSGGLGALAFLTDAIGEVDGACEGFSDRDPCSSGANAATRWWNAGGSLVVRSWLEPPRTPAAVPPGSRAERPLAAPWWPSAPKSGIASASAPWQESRTPAPPIALLTVHRR